jgi:hypothetical protein
MCILRKPTTSWPKSKSFVSFPGSPFSLCCGDPLRCTFPRTTLRRDSGCASKVKNLFLFEKVFLTLCILFRCYSCSAMDLLKSLEAASLEDLFGGFKGNDGGKCYSLNTSQRQSLSRIECVGCEQRICSIVPTGETI